MGNKKDEIKAAKITAKRRDKKNKIVSGKRYSGVIEKEKSGSGDKRKNFVGKREIPYFGESDVETMKVKSGGRKEKHTTEKITGRNQERVFYRGTNRKDKIKEVDGGKQTVRTEDSYSHDGEHSHRARIRTRRGRNGKKE